MVCFLNFSGSTDTCGQFVFFYVIQLLFVVYFCCGLVLNKAPFRPMHDEWPLLEFPDLNHTVLDLFSRFDLFHSAD